MKKTILVAAILAAISAPALAIDFSQPIQQLDGKPFDGPDGKPVPLSLGKVAESALLSSYPDEPNLSGEDKVKRFSLAKRIFDDESNYRKDTGLTADEIALIKKLVAKSYNPLVTGQAWTVLDPASMK